MPVALEVQDDVHQVLQQAGPGDGAVLRDVAHEQRGHAPLLGGPDQRARHLADLRHAAGRALDLRGGHRLHRVEDQQGRLDLVQVAEDGGQVGLGGQIEVVVERADAVGAQPHLARRLLAGHIEGAVLGAGRLGGHVQQQGGLADAGFAREQDDRARHEAAAEHPVQLRHAGRAGGGLPAVDLADGQRGAGHPARRGGPDRGRAVLLDRAPGLTLRAAAEPLGRLPAALGAAVGRAVLGRLGTGSHAETVARGTDNGTGGRAWRSGEHVWVNRSRPPPTRIQPRNKGFLSPYEGSFHPYGLKVLKVPEGALRRRLRSHG